MPHLISATDLANLARCDRQVYLDHHGDRSVRAAPDAYQAWLRDQGQKHEAEVMQQFAATKPPYTYDNLEVGFEITLGLMREGVAHIYQGVLIAGDLVGIPDLLERVDSPSGLGDWYYRPIDIKSASSASDSHRLQIMTYCVLLQSIQGLRPDGEVWLKGEADGSYQPEPVEFDEPVYARRVKEARELVGGREPQPFLSSVCTTCAWRDLCTPMAVESGDASLIPGLKREVWRVLHERGLGTLPALAAADPAAILDIKGVGAKTAPQIIQRAGALHTGRPIPLARPSLPPADCIVFDVESAPAEGVYYLMGTLIGDDYQADLAERPQDEGHMWWRFLTRMKATGGPVAHYGHYEVQTLNKLAERHGGKPDVEALLARMVDLEKLLKDSVVLPLRSYSLKSVAPWMGFSWNSEVEGGADSVLEYVRWLEDGDRAHLTRILDYNAEDCRATRVVLGWLHRLASPGE